MDPITLAITTALGQLGQTVIKDAYNVLKAAWQHKFGVDSDLVEARRLLLEHFAGMNVEGKQFE